MIATIPTMCVPEIAQLFSNGKDDQAGLMAHKHATIKERLINAFGGVEMVA
jgi:hypothetical protein